MVRGLIDLGLIERVGKKHLRHNPGAPLADLCEVLPSLSADQVRTLLKELKQEGVVRSEGRTRAGRWFATEPNRT